MPQLNTAHLHSNAWTATKIMRKSWIRAQQKDSKIHIGSVVEALISFF